MRSGRRLAHIEQLPGDASTRAYERLARGDAVAILMNQPQRAETAACPPGATAEERAALGYNALARLAAGRVDAFISCARFITDAGRQIGFTGDSASLPETTTVYAESSGGLGAYDVAITVNGVAVEAKPGELIIDACERNGVYIPRFCYHERMNPVGKCRMCLVECDTGRGPAVTVSCMVPVAPDMKIDTQSPTTKRMQEGVLELLLANHPLDCPVCDKGGECPLQDQAFSNGPGESRYVEEKRHYEKPIAISDIVYLDRERCILCDRCTRFADEVAGDALIHFSSRGNNTYITTFPDEPFSSYFSGNTVQICPVGALTAKPYRFKARPWDLSQQETTCTTCAVGCRTVVQSSRDEVLRYMGVDSDPVNHGWLCDRGRFNFEAVKSEHRVLQPLVREGDELLPASWNTALAAAAALITEAKAAGGVAGIAVIGGARGTNEDAFAWARVGHEVIGTPNVYSQMGDGLPVGLLGLDRATIDEAANATTIVLLGPDLKEELPVLYLRLRDAAQAVHRIRGNHWRRVQRGAEQDLAECFAPLGRVAHQQLFDLRVRSHRFRLRPGGGETCRPRGARSVLATRRKHTRTGLRPGTPGLPCLRQGPKCRAGRGATLGSGQLGALRSVLQLF